jgi:oxygen-dependent protoporphyrinogen oxidase
VGAAEVEAVVVGAGIAGLAAALELQSAGLEVSLIDPSDRPGGVMRTDHVNGYVVERGPNTTQVKGPMRAFLAERGGEEQLLAARPASRLRFLYRDGELVRVPMSPLALLRTPLLSTRAKWRLLAEPFARRRRGEEESVAEFVGRRLGREVVSGLVAPFLTGVYAGDEEQLGARAVFPGLVGLEDRFGSLALGGVLSLFGARGPKGLRGTYSAQAGLGPFARALADQLHEPPALGSRVMAVGRDGGLLRVEVAGSGGDLALATRRVVMACPAPEAALLLMGLDGDAARALEGIAYAPIASLPLGAAPEDLRTPVEGFGFLVPREAGLGLLGCLFMSELFPARAPEGRHLLHCMLGGARWPEVAHLPEDSIHERALADLDRTLGLRGAPESLGVMRWARAVPQPGRDHPARIDFVQQRLAEQAPGLALAGAYVAGVSVADALASGVAAARRALAT